MDNRFQKDILKNDKGVIGLDIFENIVDIIHQVISGGLRWMEIGFKGFKV
jgi:hypothetical protein